MKTVAKPSLLTATAILGLIVFLGLFVNAWIFLPTPQGWDSVHHLYLTRYVLDFWPSIDWNYQWAAGMPQFRWYPSAAYYFMAFVMKLLSLTAELSLIILVFAALAIMAVSTYSLMREVTGNTKASLVGVVLLLTSPSIWSLHVDAGLQPRLMSLAFTPLAWLFTVRYAKKMERKYLVTAIVSSSLSISFHTFYGLATLASTLLISIILMERTREKALAAIKIGTATLLLAPLPFLSLLCSPLPGFSPTSYGGATLELLGLPSTRDLLYLSPTLALLAVALPILAYSQKTTSRDCIERGIVYSLGLLSVLAVAFIAFGSFVHGGSYYLWLPIGPGEIVAFLPLCLAPLCGILLSRVYTKIRRESSASAILCLLIVLSFILQVSIHISPTSAISDFLTQRSASNPIYEELSLPSAETMYRVGVYSQDGWLGQSFNYFSKTPQTREYFSQGVLQPKWLWWLYEGIWNKTDNVAEKDFLLDWFAVKWILIDEKTSSPNIFLNKSQFKLTAKATAAPIYEFEYTAASQIITAQNAPTILVIGEYDNVLRSIAHSGLDSRRIIPIRGGEYIDDYTAEELSAYDAVFLYNYRYRNHDKAWNALQEYVSDGGGLIIETGAQYIGELDSSTPLPQIFPVERTGWIADAGNWYLTGSGEPFTVNFKSFSPAIYEAKPWGVSVSSNASLRGWAESTLWSGGRPIAAAGRYGAGRVIWSGMNLPWHLRIYENKEEARLLGKMIDWIISRADKRSMKPDFSAERTSPEQLIIRINNACEGVLFKEFYFDGWHAYLERNGVRAEELKILRAGPDLMYVPTPTEGNYPLLLVFEYDAFLERLAMALSASTLTLMLTSLIPRRRHTDRYHITVG